MNDKGVWTVAEQRDGRLAPVSFELLAWGRGLADALGVPLSSVVLAGRLAGGQLEELFQRGADLVYLVEAPELAEFRAETHANALCGLVREHRPEIVLAAATSSGRTLMPYAAMRLGTGLTADCTALDIDGATGNLLQTRPAIGGNILATIKTQTRRPQMATVRPRSIRAPERQAGRKGELVPSVFRTEWEDGRVRVAGFRANANEAINLQAAEVIVAGGRGMKKKDNFAALSRLAGLLGGAVGASRDAVDRGWAVYPQQIGLSGKTVAPRLYLGFGVSGSIQHLAGMKTAETIVAVNSDPEAQIFKVADFGIVADLFEVLPRLTSALKRERASGRRSGDGEPAEAREKP